MLNLQEASVRLALIVVSLFAIALFRFLRKRRPLSFFYNWNLSIRKPPALISICFLAAVALLTLKPLLEAQFNTLSAVLTALFIIQPLFEEILIRGFILGFMLRLTSDKHKPVLIIVQSVIFTAMHFQTGTLPIFMRMLTGTIYGFLFLFFKKNLWPSTAAHLVYNYIVYRLGFGGI